MKFAPLVLLVFSFSSSNAFLPLLGEVEYPLLFWGPQHLMKILDPSNTALMRCMQSPKGMAIMNKFNEAAACASSLGESPGDNPSPDALCGVYEKFASCFHRVAIEVAEACEYSMEEKKFVNDAIQNNENILESLCENNGDKMMSYHMYEGMNCATKKKDALLQCADHNIIIGEPRYNSEGCSSAIDFMECAARELGSCNENLEGLLNNIARDALEDLCMSEAGSVGQLPYDFDDDDDGDDDDDDDDSDEKGHHGRMGRSKRKMMEKQNELLEDMNKSLKTIISILNNHQQLLEKIAEK